nr:serine hydrolase [Aliikangiella sp. G2MR2-5]
MLLYDGKVFFEWGDIYKKHTIHSMRKPLMSALLGQLYDQGKLDLSLTLKALDAQDEPSPLTEEEQSATLDMILKSRSGIYHDAVAESEWMKKTKPKRGSHKPGEAYYYNNWNFNYAGYLYEQISGKKIYDAFYEQIARPIGMQHFKGSFTTVDSNANESIPQTDGFYDYDRKSSQYPAYHFRLSSHDLALFCQLFLNRGKWKGKQLISEEWIDKSTRPYSITNEKYGLAYGIFWAVLTKDKDDPYPHSFYHTGTGVHMIGVYPKHKLVMVHRVDTEKHDYTFKNNDLYPVIRMMHGARINYLNIKAL